MRRVALSALGLAALFVACSTTSNPGGDAGTPDGSLPADAASPSDAAVPEAAPPDAARPDAAPPPDGALPPDGAPPPDAGGDATPDARPDAADAAGACPPGMVAMPGGTFMMGGDDPDANPDEQPVVSRTLAAFCVDATEVTMGAYEACVTAGGCTPAIPGGYCNTGVPARVNNPANCLDWAQAGAYCRHVGKRLPTEEEWEYTARETSRRLYPWGSTPAPGTQLCWSAVNPRDRPGQPDSGTCAVGGYPAGDTPRGVKDMAGNVWEWTSSGYSVNHTSPRNDATKIIRGGGWDFTDPRSVRASYRLAFDPTYVDVDIGIRCVR